YFVRAVLRQAPDHAVEQGIIKELLGVGSQTEGVLRASNHPGEIYYRLYVGGREKSNYDKTTCVGRSSSPQIPSLFDSFGSSFATTEEELEEAARKLPGQSQLDSATTA
ncbi:hypothetical protein BGW38_009511, partial [Lunasporangiospora selenospora]